MNIINLRVNHLTDPVGFMMDNDPVFSWVVDASTEHGTRQKAAQIVVSADPFFNNVITDTGMLSDASSLGTKVHIPLKPRTVYYWKVCVLTDTEEILTSDTHSFETSKQEEPWCARWITCETEERHPIFSKSFTLAADPSVSAQEAPSIVSARLYISGLGLYHAYLNGQEVTREKLTPYYTNYDEWVQYQTYDVTDLLKAHETTSLHTLSVIVGNGWYSGRIGFTTDTHSKGYYGSSQKMIAELHVRFSSGEEFVLGSDESWDVTRSTITFSNIYDGEHRDDTLPEVPAVKASLLCEEEVEKYHLRPRLSLPVLVHEELKGELLTTPAGEKVFDTHQNLAGGFRLRICEPLGTRIHIQTGEVLQHGSFYNDNLRTALSEYWYVSDGKEHVLEPLFTFYGYRYVKVDGASHLKEEDFTAQAYYSDIRTVGTLETGHRKLNQLIQNIQWGQKGNFIDIPTDCPQRDERMGWTADTQVFVPTACYFTDPYAFYDKWLYDLRGEQKMHDGMVPDTIPATGVGGGGSVWGDAATIVPWTLYEYFGDITILEKSLQSMIDWVEYVRRVDGDDHGFERVFHYGDWLALDNPNGKIDEVKGGTSDAYIANVYYLNSCQIISKAAKLLAENTAGKALGSAGGSRNGTADNETAISEYLAISGKYEGYAKTIHQYIYDEFISRNGRLTIDTQTAYILALRHHLFPEHEDRLQRDFVHSLERRDGKLCTGFVGTPFLCQELSKMGRNDMALKILLSEEYPGWFYEINLGATTVWERWNSLDENGMVTSIGMNSFNHYAYGSIAEWMWKALAGIQADISVPGFKKAVMKPVPNTEIGSCRGSYLSAAGLYETEWKLLDPSHVYIRISVPFDCTAELDTGFIDGSEEKILLTPGVFEKVFEMKAGGKAVLTVDSPVSEIIKDERVKVIAETVFPNLADLPGSMKSLTFRELVKQQKPEGMERIGEVNQLFLKG